MFSAIRPYVQIGSMLAISNIAACSTNACESEELPSSCDPKTPEEVAKDRKDRAEVLADMKTLADQFGYVHQVYRFSHSEKNDLNGNQLDDWLLIRTPKGRKHYVVDASVILDRSMTDFDPAKLDALMESYVLENPDQPSRTISRPINNSKTGELASMDNASALRSFGPLLPGVVTFFGLHESDGLPVREINFSLNAMVSLIIEITPHDYENCASKVLVGSLYNVPEAGTPPTGAEELKQRNASRGGLTIKAYR
jgi:hypothetical protein